MDTGTAFAISASGLRAQRLRMDVIAANLANAESTQTPGGGPYQRQDVVLESLPVGDRFDDLLGRASGSAVRVARIVSDDRPPRLVFDPSHPHANVDGYLQMPDINVVSEMVDMMSATRAYEANVAAVNATKRVLEATLGIGQS